MLLPKIPHQYNIERFHMTSRRPSWCSKTMKRRPCWCYSNNFFVHINLHRCWPREWKHSIGFSMQKIVYSSFSKGCFGHWELSIGKLLLGSHSSKLLHCSICPMSNYQCTIIIFVFKATFFDLANGERTTIGLIGNKATLHVQQTFFVHCTCFARLQRETS